MSSLSVPVGDTLEIISVSSVRYGGSVYRDVTSITLADGTVTTCEELLIAAGGVNYSSNELKRCVKVEAIDPDSNNRGIWTCYSTNSRQTGKNSVKSVPGGLWIEMFNFLGDITTNPIFNLWKTVVPVAGVHYTSTWLGFKINYGTTDTRTYVLTQVNDFLEESIPTDPVAIDITYMHDALLSGKFVAPEPLDSAFYVPIKAFNLYRSNVTADGFAVYQKIPGDPVSVEPNVIADSYGTFPHSVYAYNPTDFTTVHGWEFTDRILAVDLGVTLPSLDWDAPPPRKLMGLTSWRNGMLAAFADNLLYFCEPFRPFAWPQKYIVALPSKILALVVDENALVVLTDNEPFIFSGSHPSNATYERMQNVEAVLSPDPNVGGFVGPSRAVTKTPSGIVYGSVEGPILIASGRAKVLARVLFTREEWADRYKDVFGKMRFAYSDGNLLCYFTNGEQGFYLNLTDGDPLFVRHSPSHAIVNDFVMPNDDSLYVVSEALDGSTISRFADEDQARTQFEYHTREVISSRPVNFGVLQITGYGVENTTLLASVYGDGQLRGFIPLVFTNATNPLAYTFRLPGGYKARRWRVTLNGWQSHVVQEAHLAGTMSDLASV